MPLWSVAATMMVMLVPDEGIAEGNQTGSTGAKLQTGSDATAKDPAAEIRADIADCLVRPNKFPPPPHTGTAAAGSSD